MRALLIAVLLCGHLSLLLTCVARAAPAISAMRFDKENAWAFQLEKLFKIAPSDGRAIVVAAGYRPRSRTNLFIAAQKTSKLRITDTIENT